MSLNDRKLKLCMCKYIGKICLESKFQPFWMLDNGDMERSTLIAKDPLWLQSTVLGPKVSSQYLNCKKNGAHFSKCQKQPFFVSFLVFSIYRGGGTPQTPSTIINFESLGVKYVTKCSIWDFKISWDMDSGSE